MREVAVAPDPAHVNTASATSAGQSVLFISCSPRGRTAKSLPVACQPRRFSKYLKNSDFL
jgi:hypothetical protein